MRGLKASAFGFLLYIIVGISAIFGADRLAVLMMRASCNSVSWRARNT